MAAKKSVRLAAREAMQAFNYDPLTELVQLAQATDNNGIKQEIAVVLLPYLYPRLSNMALEGEVVVGKSQESQAALLRRVLEDPELADAAQRLSVAASMAALESDSGIEDFSTLQ
jgi:hypothetical protein